MSRKVLLKRLLELHDSRKVSDADVDSILNGMVVNGQYVYTNGQYALAGRVVSLGVDKIKKVCREPLITKAKAPAPKPTKAKAPAPTKKGLFS